MDINSKLINLIKTHPLFKNTGGEINSENYQHLTYLRLLEIIKLDIIDVETMELYPQNFITAMNTLHAYDLSLAVKAGVNFGLFGGGILRLGLPSQVYLLKLVNTGHMLGGLAITEIGHGSNLKGLETTAIWNPIEDNFEINSPTTSATKCWIGNSKHGNFVIVFAQLYYQDNCLGLHPFIVPLRLQYCQLELFQDLIDSHSYQLLESSDPAQNEKYQVDIPGVTVKLNDYKGGLNGVDNGMITFNNLKIPRTNLLGKYGYIDAGGKYIASHKNIEKRFADLLSTLSAGRGVLSFGANIVTMKALQIGYQYTRQRVQFSGNNNIEKSIIDYHTTAAPIALILSQNYCINTTLQEMLKIGLQDFNANGGKISKRVHALSSGLKVIASELAFNTCDKMRLLCGGYGYAYGNELVKIRGDIDIWRTFEGDNTLLRQEVCKYLLENLQKDPQKVQKILSSGNNNNINTTNSNNINSNNINSINTTNINNNNSAINSNNNFKKPEIKKLLLTVDLEEYYNTFINCGNSDNNNSSTNSNNNDRNKDNYKTGTLHFINNILEIFEEDCEILLEQLFKNMMLGMGNGIEAFETWNNNLKLIISISQIYIMNIILRTTYNKFAQKIESDLEVSDLEVSDLEVSDLEVSDLEVSDLEVSDLEVSDLEVSDLEVSDLEEFELLKYWVL